jgi:hypothetical protein
MASVMFVGDGMVLTWLTSLVFRGFTGSFLTDSLACSLPLSGLDIRAQMIIFDYLFYGNRWL